MEKNIEKIAIIKKYIIDYHDKVTSEIDIHFQLLLLKRNKELISNGIEKYNQCDKTIETYMSYIEKVKYICEKNLALFSTKKIVPIDNNVIDINRRARLIRDYYDKQIHEKIIEMGKNDWSWVENENCSQKFQNHVFIRKFHSEEEILNYIYK